ncbi:uncharacterized protein Dwil_GK13451 [Drosophila willistoni]|uniref:Protein takeout n=1 Tax=Drosophila willistoni TaxID=7260 RepID=B4NJ75_DROWI|nr:protein takeout [Drosophila willistoni]EDW83868.2 uncharacterized protein Dwil_GK13451 [Drosophila willistoni]
MLPRFICLPILTLVLCQAVHAKFPDDPKACKYGDAACMVKFMNNLIKEKGIQGDDDLNLLKLDPFPVAKMNIKQGGDSPVNIDLTFTNNDIIGLSNLKFKKAKGFGKDLAKKHELLFHAPSLRLEGPYDIKGQVLVLPISGSGKSNITLVKPDFIASFVGKPVVKDGQTYMEATNFKLNTKAERLWYFFGNLFNGDKALGDNMNAFLNDNWHAIFLECQESVQAAFSEVFQNIITTVFSKYPYEKFFSD